MAPAGQQQRFTLTQVAGSNLAHRDRPPVLNLSEKEQLVGRSDRCDLQITVPTVSRQHALAWVEEGAPVIQDLDSGHGTFVNSTRIDQPYVLKPGDLVAMGPDIVFLVASSQGGETSVPEKGDPAAVGAGTGSQLIELALADVTPESPHKRHMQTLARLLSGMDAATNEEELLDLVLREVQGVIAAERLIALRGESPDELTGVAKRFRPGSEKEEWHPPSHDFLRRGMLAGKAVTSFDARTDRRFRNRVSVALGNIRSAVCVALQGADGPLGLLYADTRATAGLYSAEDATFMDLVGRCVGARLQLFVSRQQHQEFRTRRDEGSAVAEDIVSQLDAAIHSHLNRLELIADDAEAEQGASMVARMLRAEHERLFGELDQLLSWSHVAVTRRVSETDLAAVDSSSGETATDMADDASPTAEDHR